MNRIDELKVLLEKYDEAYYNQEQALISDQEYDTLKEEYLSLGGNDFVSGTILNGNKIKHTFHVSSLEKVKASETDKLREMLTKLFPVTIQAKLDGLTLVQYADHIVTRGNGEIGECKDDKKPYINGIGDFFGLPVRGEALMLKSDFEKINQELINEGKEPFSNTRNAISGMLNRKNIIPKGITYFAYYVHGIDNPLEQLQTLKDNGYNVIESYVPTSIEDAINYLENFDKESLPYDIDGLVVKSLRNEDFGSTAHHPKNAFAYKMENEAKWTELIDVEWNVGKSGIISPVGVFKPVELNGAMVERATLHNIEYINALGLDKIYCDNHHRTLVNVTRSNEVIPRILACKHEIDDGYDSIHAYVKDVSLPKVCPECNGKVERKNDLIYCTNPFCKEKVIAQAVHMVSRDCLDIRGLSEETIRKMYEYKFKRDNQVYNYTFPLDFTYDEILSLDGFAKKSAQKLYDEIQNKLQKVPFVNFLCASNIPLLGKSTAKLIDKAYDDYEKLQDDIFKDNGKILLSIDGCGQELFKSLYDTFDNLYILDQCITEIVYSKKQEVIDSAIKDKVFVVTGDVHIFKNRKELQSKIESLGGKVTGSVSKKTDYVICNNDDSSSSKMKKAKELNIPILTEEDFVNLIG